MFCTHCGKEIPEAANFCKSCGAAVDKPATRFEPEEVSGEVMESSELETLDGETKADGALKRIGQGSLAIGIFSSMWLYWVATMIAYGLVVIAFLMWAFNLFSQGSWLLAALVLIIGMPIALALTAYFVPLVAIIAIIAGVVWLVSVVFQAQIPYLDVFGGVWELFWTLLVVVGVGYFIYGFWRAYRDEQLKAFLAENWFYLILLGVITWFVVT